MLSALCLFLLNCTFCKPEVLSTQSVYETERFTVLVDNAPRVPGHLIVVPKKHKAKAEELESEEWKELSYIIPAAVKVFQAQLGTDQYLILEKNGPRAFQSISHVHFHLFPITQQSWADIFDCTPIKLTPDEFAVEIETYRYQFRVLSLSPTGQ